MPVRETIVINGNELSFESGETILTVARRNQIDIPTLCYLKGASPTGNCRICIVEIEGEKDLIPAGENYKKGCLVHVRDPREIHNPAVQGEYTFAPDPEWIRIVEFYCPHCGIMIENEYLPPGHPVTHDIDLDLTELQQKYLNRG